jgi:hypothetical protein
MHESWEDDISQEEQWAKSSLTEIDRRTFRRIVSKYLTTTAAELN